MSSKNEEELNAGKSVSVFFPNQGENQRGAHINVSGIALTKNSKNKENAIKLIKYLQSDEAQKTYINNTYEETQKWSDAIVKNFARDPKGNDRDQVKAIAAGQGDVAIVNSYYIGLLLSSKNEEELNAGKSVSVFFPNQGENQRGAHINVSGIALTKNSKNKENAIKLIKYLQSDEAQKTYVNNTYEYSVNPSISPNDIVKEWGEFKMDDLDLNILGSRRDEAIRIFDKSGWK